MKKLLSIFRRQDDLPLQLRLYRAICGCTAVLCIGGIFPLNFFQHLPAALDVLIPLVGVVSAFFYFRSWHGRHDPMAYFLVVLALINPIWFLNGGADGSVPFYLLSITLYPIAVFRGWKRWVCVALILVDGLALFLTAHFFPGLSVSFLSPVDRVLDLTTGFLGAIVITAGVVWLIVDTHDAEVQRQSIFAHELARSEGRRRLLFEESPDGLVVIDMATLRFTEFNAAAHKLLGYSREEYGRLRVTDIEAFQSPQDVQRHLEQLQREGRDDFETKHRHKNGELLDIYVTAKILDLEDQRVVQCAYRDVTQAKRAAEALREAHERLRRLGDNLPGGYIYQMAQTEGGGRTFTYVSAGVEGVHGVHPEAVLADARVLLQQVLPEDLEQLLAREQEARRTHSRFASETRIRSLAGEVKWLRLVSAPTTMPDGAVRWDGVALDITETKFAEEQRLVLSKLESTGILAGGLAHDFNNLIGAIQLSADLLAADDCPPAQKHECLQTIRQASAGARRLTQQLITFSQGGSPIRRRVTIEPVLRESVEIALSGSAADAKIVVAEKLWHVEIDEGQISQALRNLVLNAREAMPGGGRVTVLADNAVVRASEVPGLAAGEYVRVRISDEGDGIPVAVLPRLFDPYFSTKRRGAQKGMGLGLTISLSVLKKHGGTITVESLAGRGSTFTLYLPGWRPTEQPPAVVAPQARAPDRMAKLLVMDDEQVVRSVVSAAATKVGCRVTVTGEGGEALREFRAAAAAGEPFDVVLLDLTVRNGLGGLDTLTQLRALDPNVKALVMSGYTDNDALQNFARHGFVGAVPKPFNLVALQAALANVLKT